MQTKAETFLVLWNWVLPALVFLMSWFLNSWKNKKPKNLPCLPPKNDGERFIINPDTLTTHFRQRVVQAKDSRSHPEFLCFFIPHLTHWQDLFVPSQKKKKSPKTKTSKSTYVFPPPLPSSLATIIAYLALVRTSSLVSLLPHLPLQSALQTVARVIFKKHKSGHVTALLGNPQGFQMPLE